MTLKDEPGPLTVQTGDDPIVPVSGGISPLGDLELVQSEQQTRDGGRNISRGRLVFKRLLRKRLAMFGLFLLVAEVVLAYLGPHITHWKLDDIDANALGTLDGLGPNSSHWFGADSIGHDVFLQTMLGTQTSLQVGLIAAVVSTGVAAIVGSVAGYFGKATDNALMWFVNLMMVVPSFLILAIISPALKNTGFIVFALLLAAFNWMLTARVVRGLTFSLREREFVSAAKFMGVPAWRIISRHILPNMASLLIVDVTINVSSTILAETGLSYFGFGIQPPDVSLGTLIQASSATSPDATQYWWTWAFPGLMLVAMVLAVNFLGDGLRDALDATSGSGDD
ncbi:MAG: ABC transporter permease [Jatrophihabitans sp.]|uniref:ABC transporter permease n=1 Tax=Jatrophihabitans sp. TaxID=1932789 RepID=UPI003F7E7C2B